MGGGGHRLGEGACNSGFDRSLHCHILRNVLWDSSRSSSWLVGMVGDKGGQLVGKGGVMIEVCRKI